MSTAAANQTSSQCLSPVAEKLKYAIVDARRTNNLIKGLHQCSKFLEQSNAVLCVATLDISHQAYAELVPVLCSENNIPLMTVNDSQTLAIWAGQGQIDAEGDNNRINTNGCSIIVIKRWDVNNQNIKELVQHMTDLQNRMNEQRQKRQQNNHFNNSF